MDDPITILWIVVVCYIALGWAGWNYLMGRVDTMSAVIRSQQLVIDHLLDLTKADQQEQP